MTTLIQKEFRLRVALLALLFGSYFGSLWVGSLYFPHAYDWRRNVISNLLSPRDDRSATGSPRWAWRWRGCACCAGPRGSKPNWAMAEAGWHGGCAGRRSWWESDALSCPPSSCRSMSTRSWECGTRTNCWRGPRRQAWGWGCSAPAGAMRLKRGGTGAAKEAARPANDVAGNHVAAHRGRGRERPGGGAGAIARVGCGPGRILRGTVFWHLAFWEWMGSVAVFLFFATAVGALGKDEG